MQKTINYKIILILLISFLLSDSVSLSQNKSITIIVESLPGNTPADEPIFVCGNFNNWNIRDTIYQLKQRADGKLMVNIPDVADTIQFKFSRGDWMKIETSSDNSYLPNRTLIDKTEDHIDVRIQNWQDLGGRTSMPVFVFILSAAILNGIFLIILLRSKKKKYDTRKTRHTIIWTLTLILVLLGAVIYEFSNPLWKFRLMQGFELMLFLAGPFVFTFYRSFLTKIKSLSPAHYTPALLIFILNMFRLSGLWQTAWLQDSLKTNLFLIDAILILTGSISLLTYVSLSIFTLLRHKKATKRENTSPQYAFSINSPNEVTSETTPAASSEWMFLYLTGAINLVAVIAGISLFWLVASGLLQLRNYQDIPLSLSSIQLFVIFYFVYFNEAIFYPPKAEKINDLNRILANRILMIMQESKPFLNPDLTLAGFAESIDNKPHTISKTINECFNKNFRDFINEYRVNEFIKKMDSEDAKNMTFLYLAYEAGFNSKSTFNLAFKKVTGLSPREYFSAGK